MGNAIHQIRAHVLDMLATTRRLLGPAAAQLRAPGVQASPQAAWLIEQMVRLLNAHADDLAEHLQRLGGGALTGETGAPNEPAPAVTLNKAMLDNYSKLSLSQAAAMMLETNARALGYSSTAALAARHREEIDSILAQMREFMPLAA